MRPSNGTRIGDAELREALEKIQLLEGSQQARVAGTAPTLPTTQAYPTGRTTGLTIGQPATALPAANNRGPWAATRDRYQQQAMPLPQTPVMTGVSTGVPSAVPPSGVASTFGAALPAMMVPNPSTPLGAFPGQSPLQTSPQLPADEYFKREKSPLPKLTIKSGDAATSAIQLWHHAVSVAKAAHQQWTMMVPAQRALQTGLPFIGHSLPPQLSVLEATMRADLVNTCLPDRVQSLAIQKASHYGR